MVQSPVRGDSIHISISKLIRCIDKATYEKYSFSKNVGDSKMHLVHVFVDAWNKQYIKPIRLFMICIPWKRMFIPVERRQREKEKWSIRSSGNIRSNFYRLALRKKLWLYCLFLFSKCSSFYLTSHPRSHFPTHDLLRLLLLHKHVEIWNKISTECDVVAASCRNILNNL